MNEYYQQEKKIEINESVKPLGASEDFFPLVIHFLSLI